MESCLLQPLAARQPAGTWAKRETLTAPRSQLWRQRRQPRAAAAAAARRGALAVAATAEAPQSGGSAGQQSVATARRVVMAVDASDDSIAAFHWVLTNLLKPGDELHLLHVVPDVFTSPQSGSIYYCSSPDPETERALWQQTKQFFVDHFLEHAKCIGLEDVCWLHLVKESRHKHIGKAVCKKAEELGAEPLVVAAHDKGIMEKLLLGSVSEYCAAHSKRPVLLLHPNHSML